ncbi:MAG: TIGR02594 family protein [Caldithrix sp.]|nr:TIGR02594 family protein [Caldithrix sp.]
MKSKMTILIYLSVFFIGFFNVTLYSQERSIIPQPNPNSDETHWAAAFINHSMQKAGVEGTNSRRALSWLKWGIPLEKPTVGSIAVLDYGGGRGHVGFVKGTYKDMIVLLGGNQKNEVNLTAFPIDDIVSFRWPKGSQPSSYYIPFLRCFRWAHSRVTQQLL